MSLSRKKFTTEQRMVMDLEKALKKVSKNKIPLNIRHDLAVKTVSRLNFDNRFQMQCSLQSYAEALSLNYFKEKRKYRA